MAASVDLGEDPKRNRSRAEAEVSAACALREPFRWMKNPPNRRCSLRSATVDGSEGGNVTPRAAAECPHLAIRSPKLAGVAKTASSSEAPASY